MAEQIIVTIDESGEPTIEVKGVKGKSCVDLTKAIEEALGQVTNETKTREFHENARVQTRNIQRR